MKQSLVAQLSQKTDHWTTPKELYDQLEQKFGKFDTDPCPLNTTENSLIEKEWIGNVFCNPPYSNVKEFLNKGLIEIKRGNAKQIVFLIIPRTSTKYWRDYVMTYADKIYWIDHRLKFGNSKSSAPFPSCIVVFNNIIKKTWIPVEMLCVEGEK